ncbi:MAG: hypothetical protein NXI10_16775 [bacterium]|nr:hypothetical protein [bacterium]
MRIAAEKMRRKKEQEEKEEKEFYEKITSGWRWKFFTGVMIFCTLMALCTTIDTFFDGSSRKLAREEWRYDTYWRMEWHKIVVVDDARFTPHFSDWSDRVEGTFEITYSPIFQVGKELSYDIKNENGSTRRHTETRWGTVLAWFPFFQLLALILLFTFIFKQRKPWFNFARIASLYMAFPGTLLAVYSLLVGF